MVKKQSGISLIELLIYIGVLAVTAFVLVGIVTTFFGGRGRVVAREEVSSNLRFSMNKVANDIRSASEISEPAGAGASSTQLTATVGGSTVIYCVADSRLRRETSGSCTSSSNALTSDDVSVDNLSFTRFENSNAVLNKTRVSIEVDISMSFNDSRPDYQYSADKTAVFGVGSY